MKILLDKIFLSIFGVFLIIFGGFFTLGALLFGSTTTFGIDVFIALIFGLLPLGTGLHFLRRANNQNLNYYEAPTLNQTKLPKFSQEPRPKPLDQQEHLHEVFYRLLETKHGLLTVLNLAASARVSGKVAENFLKEKVKEFNHQVIVGPDGEIAYKFEYLTDLEIKAMNQD